MTDPFDPTTPKGNQSAGTADDHIRDIKQVLLNWKADVTVNFPTRLTTLETNVTNLNNTVGNQGDEVRIQQMISKIYSDLGDSNDIKITVPELQTDDDYPPILVINLAAVNTGSAVTLQVNDRAPVPVLANGGTLPVISTLVPGWFGEFWWNEAASAYIYSNPAPLGTPLPYTELRWDYTDGTQQTWVVPIDVFEIEYVLQGPGGRGGDTGGAGGGAGAYATGKMAVTPGQNLFYRIQSRGYYPTGTAPGVRITYDGIDRICNGGNSSATGNLGYQPPSPGGTYSGPVDYGANGAPGYDSYDGLSSISRVGGRGADSLFGTGGPGRNRPGRNASGFGAGGGGCMYANGGGSGGNGSQGFIKVRYLTPS